MAKLIAKVEKTIKSVQDWTNLPNEQIQEKLANFRRTKLNSTNVTADLDRPSIVQSSHRLNDKENQNELLTNLTHHKVAQKQTAKSSRNLSITLLNHEDLLVPDDRSQRLNYDSLAANHNRHSSANTKPYSRFKRSKDRCILTEVPQSM